MPVVVWDIIGPIKKKAMTGIVTSCPASSDLAEGASQAGSGESTPEPPAKQARSRAVPPLKGIRGGRPVTLRAAVNQGGNAGVDPVPEGRGF